MEIETLGEDCLCDFTFDFYWQHHGSRLNPDRIVSSFSYRQLVNALRRGESVRINGDVGNRLGSSLGVDLVKFGGTGGAIENTGKIVVDGDVGNRLGISMLRGAIYVSGRVESPLGNIIEAESDLVGYKKYISATEALEKCIPVLEPNFRDKKGLIICDGIPRDTLGARNSTDGLIRLEGDSGMSTGILMRSGLVEISGDSDRNTGVLMRGGRIIVRGCTGDFTGTEMLGGEIFVGENAGSFSCAKMRGGVVYAKAGKPVPPAREYPLSVAEGTAVARAFGMSPLCAMIYRKFSL